MKSPHAPGASRRFLRHGLLPQLAAFEAVVRLGSAAQAAEALCIAPSTLSGHVRKLSDTLGVRLFELQGKQLVPTDAALPLLAAVDEIFDAFARCECALAPLRGADRRGGRERIDNGASMTPSAL
jgi:DNA-binding transcriptional LysR family regulator